MNQQTNQFFSEQEENRQKARIVSTIIIAVECAYLTAMISGFVYRDTKLIIVTLAGCAFQILPYVLVRRGNLRISSLLVVLSALCSVTFIATVGQGIRDLAIISFPIIFIFAGLTLDRVFFRISVALALLAVFWLTFGEAMGWFVTVPFNGENSNWIYLMMVAILLVIAGVAVDLLAANMRSNLALTKQEIVQRKQAEKEIKTSERRFHALIEHGRDNISLLSSAGILLWESPSTAPMLGYAADQFGGHNIFELIHPNDQAWTSEMFAQVLQTAGNIREGELRLLHADGSWRWIECSAVNLLDEPAVQAIVLNYRDISKRKLIENALREKEIQYRNLADSGIALIWMSGTDKLCNYFNLPWLKFTGRTLEQEMGNGWVEGVHPDDLGYCMTTYATAFDQHAAFDMDYRLRHRSGEYRWIQDIGTPNFNSQEKFIGYIGHCFDITDRKRAELALLESEEKFRKIIEYATDGITLTDERGLIIEWNAAQQQITGLTHAEVVGRPLWEIQFQSAPIELRTPQTYEKLQQGFQDILASAEMPGHTREGEARVQGPNGTSRIIHSIIFGIKTVLGFRLVGFSRDITERKRAEDQIRYQGTHDALTGIYNRAYFEEELARLENSHDFPISLVIADVDGLKVLNDTSGHQVGDELLRQVADVLSSVFRGEDVLARIGGDEFAVLLPATKETTAEKMLARVRERVKQQNSEHPELPVEISLGMATAEKSGLTAAFTLADQRMYANKAARKADKNKFFAS
jgi:diguanylate cyclase (GGDEF)-like protein/PAS domain S-box-containing protein